MDRRRWAERRRVSRKSEGGGAHGGMMHEREGVREGGEGGDGVKRWEGEREGVVVMM